MKRSLILLALFALTACGFEPMYSREYQQQGLGGELAAIEIRTPKGILGESLRAEIEDAINPEYANVQPRYRLMIELVEEDIPLFINLDGTSNRGDIRYRSHYTLVRLADNKQLNSGNITRIASYNSSQTADYAAFVSREDAKKRAILELAQDYKLRLANLSARMTP